MQERAKEWPHGMTTTATHDTKRGEDARARIMAIAEIAGEWTAAVARWKVLNARHVAAQGNFRAPSATFEYMLYQTLLGIWQPEDGSLRERLQAYALKATREGKEETSWLNPHPRYEKNVADFIAHILDRSISAEFLDSFEAIGGRIALLGALNSISQLTLKATLPGVPDFYQGTELWDFSMVDPDNRRSVDYAVRASALAALEKPDWPELVRHWRDGRLKLAWTRELLRLRQLYPDLFANGDYVPLEVHGRDRDHVIAYARRYGRKTAINVDPTNRARRVFPHITATLRKMAASAVPPHSASILGHARPQGHRCSKSRTISLASQGFSLPNHLPQRARLGDRG
jgi:(1->4)-alpha-D-glucan 1-alpha-D-glucosylmutase